MVTENILSYLDSISCQYNTDVSLSDFTSFKIGGPVPVMVQPDSAELLCSVLSFLRSEKIPYYVLGKGTNVLFNDDGYDGVIIQTEKLNKIELTDEKCIHCECGVPLYRLCSFALEKSLTGLEFAYGIPGSCGGAAFMNAGAYGGEMKDVLIKCRYIDENGELQFAEGEDMCLSYRHSIFSDINCIITDLYVKLNKGDSASIRESMNEIMDKRRSKQPLEYPSAGSTFKRPEGYFAGALIEKSNLKGFSFGGAMVSTKHAGFVINYDNATCSDVISLINIIKETVKKDSGVELEPEVIII